MDTFTDTHRLFLQGMLSRGAITEEAAKDLYQQAAEASSSDGGKVPNVILLTQDL